MSKRPVTAYFLFADEVRESVKAELREVNPNNKVSVGDVAKATGEKWRQLDSAQKKTYQDRAAQAAEVFKAEADNAPVVEEDADDNGPDKPHVALPHAAVKRIMCCDSDVSRVSADAVQVVSEAASYLLHLLATKAVDCAKKRKRKTVTLEDFEAIVRQDKRLVEAGLKEIALDKEFYHQNHPHKVDTADDPSSGDKPLADAKARRITSFFTST